MNISLQQLEGQFTIHRFSNHATVPVEALSADFFSITRTDDELSLVVPSSVQLTSDKHEDSWACLKVLGPLDFSLTGILAGISQILAEAEVSIFAVSTFDTDYILVKQEKVELAVNALRKNGYQIADGRPS